MNIAYFIVRESELTPEMIMASVCKDVTCIKRIYTRERIFLVISKITWYRVVKVEATIENLSAFSGRVPILQSKIFDIIKNYYNE